MTRDSEGTVTTPAWGHGAHDGIPSSRVVAALERSQRLRGGMVSTTSTPCRVAACCTGLATSQRLRGGMVSTTRGMVSTTRDQRPQRRPCGRVTTPAWGHGVHDFSRFASHGSQRLRGGMVSTTRARWREVTTPAWGHGVHDVHALSRRGMLHGDQGGEAGRASQASQRLRGGMVSTTRPLLKMFVRTSYVTPEGEPLRWRQPESAAVITTPAWGHGVHDARRGDEDVRTCRDPRTPRSRNARVGAWCPRPPRLRRRGPLRRHHNACVEAWYPRRSGWGTWVGVDASQRLCGGMVSTTTRRISRCA